MKGDSDERDCEEEDISGVGTKMMVSPVGGVGLLSPAMADWIDAEEATIMLSPAEGVELTLAAEEDWAEEDESGLESMVMVSTTTGLQSLLPAEED